MPGSGGCDTQAREDRSDMESKAATTQLKFHCIQTFLLYSVPELKRDKQSRIQKQHTESNSKKIEQLDTLYHVGFVVLEKGGPN
jgi:hypothetical protein